MVKGQGAGGAVTAGSGAPAGAGRPRDAGIDGGIAESGEEGGVPVLNPTEGSLLGFLLDGPKTGWDLLQEVSSALHRFWNVTPSHVYRELKVLADRGLVTAGEPGPRDARPFAVTDAGRAAFAQWLDQEPAHETIRFPLLVTLWFGRHLDPDRLAGFLRSHRRHHRRRLAAYRAVAAATPGDPYVDAVVTFGVAYEAAVVRWLDQVTRDRQTGDGVAPSP